MFIKDICNSCIKTDGGCCTDVILNIHASEVKPFEKQFLLSKAPKNHTLNIDLFHPDQYIYHSAKEPCMFLGKDNACSIYDQRPLVCRMYPLKWQNKKYFHIDLSCPLAHSIPFQEILDWTTDPKNSDLIKVLDAENFNNQSLHYASITSLKNKYKQLEILDDPELKIYKERKP